MKIVCESCGAKYSIADEKVAGKVFKIRCKRCSEVIMVRGDQQPEQAQEAAPAAEGPADAIWHVVVNGEQQGPHTPAQLGEMLTNGTVDWDAYVWTEGFENWVPMRDVENLVAQITGSEQATADAAQQQTTAAGGFHAVASSQGAAASDAYTAQPSMGADPFAEPPATTSEQAGPDLFGDGAGSAPQASPFETSASGAEVAAAQAATPQTREPAMTGTRNENSVLFSLKNLQALATGSSTSSAAPPTAAAAGGPAGFASGEGSGLIDIRALASATGINEGNEGHHDKDELLAMGGQGAAFGTLGSPMLTPSSDDREGGNRTLILAAIIGGSVVIAAGLMAFALLRQQEPPPAPPEVGIAPIPAVAPPAQPAAAPIRPEQPSEGELAAQAAAKQQVGAQQRSASSDRGSRRKSEPRKRKSDDAPQTSEKTAAAQPPPAAPPKRRPRGGSASLDELLAGALESSGKPRAPKPSKPANNLPQKPGRKDVVNAMNRVKGAVSACAKGAGGVAFANVTVSGSTGRVKNVQIEGQTGAIGSCIARAVRKARFQKFKSNTFKVKYPFRL